MATRKTKYGYYVINSINAAKLSIELYNRVDFAHSIHGALIFLSQAWELLAKAYIIRKKDNIYYKDGTSISAEKAVNRLYHQYNHITLEENQTIQQIISLRNEAQHGILPTIESEIITHLLYFSLKTYHDFISKSFKSYFKSFDRNFLAISFKEYTFYSNKVSKLFSVAKKINNEKNKLLYLLDRGADFATIDNGEKMTNYKSWITKIKQLQRNARVSRHLTIYDYIQNQEDVRFVPIAVKRGYRPEVALTKTNNPLAPVVIKRTDPNIDFPHLTSDVANKLNKDVSFIAKMSRKLKIYGNDQYCSLIKINKRGNPTPKYNDKAVNYLKNYLDTHRDFNPYLS